MISMRLIFSFFIIVFSGCFSAIAEELNVDVGSITLQPLSKISTEFLVERSIFLPAVCAEHDGECTESAILALYNGTEIPIRSGVYFYDIDIDGIIIGIKLSDEHITSLKFGKGGIVDLFIKQSTGPYHTGSIFKELFSYKHTNSFESDQRNNSIIIKLNGNITSGSCSINRGSHLNFTVHTSVNEKSSYSNNGNKMFVQNEILEFDCVNVNSIAIKFSSTMLDSNDSHLIIDKETGIALSLEYESNGVSGNVLWDRSPIHFPVINNKAMILFTLFVKKTRESIRPGKIFISGVYTIDYN